LSRKFLTLQKRQAALILKLSCYNKNVLLAGFAISQTFFISKEELVLGTFLAVVIRVVVY